MFPKVTTNPLDMELQLREYMDDICAEEWATEYLNPELFIGSYCYGLVWLRLNNPFVLLHELIHHIAEKLKFICNSEKFDLLNLFNELPNAMYQKNYYVFYGAIKEIRELLHSIGS